MASSTYHTYFRIIPTRLFGTSTSAEINKIRDSNSISVERFYSSETNLTLDLYEAIKQKTEEREEAAKTFHLLGKNDEEKVSKDVFTFSVGDNLHTCRETVLSQIKRIQLLARNALKVCYHTAIIEYVLERQEKLSETKLNLIKEFISSEKILSDDTTIKVSDKGTVIIEYCPGKSKRDAEISLLLWIFRHDFIMEDILSNIKRNSLGKITAQAFYNYLSYKFLEAPDWCNDANPGEALSLFCFFKAKEETLSNLIGDGDFELIFGVCDYARSCISFNIIKDWFLEIYLPALTLGKISISNRIKSHCRNFGLILKPLSELHPRYSDEKIAINLYSKFDLYKSKKEEEEKKEEESFEDFLKATNKSPKLVTTIR